MPIQMKCEPHDMPVQQVPYVQQLQQVVGNGLGFVPQMGMPVSVPHGIPHIIPPVSSAPPAIVPVTDKQKPSIPSDPKPGENIEDRIDVESIKGVFGWETLDNVNVPYILRKKKKYVAVRIVERKLLSRYPNSFPDELSKKEPLVSYFVTEHEAKLLNEINSIHCSYEYGHQEFTGKDLIVDLAEFEDFYNIVKKTFPDDVLAKFRGVPQQVPESPVPQQPLQSVSQPEHDKHELAKVCGWVQINNTVSPYIKRFNGKYVPLSVIKYAAGLLTDIQVDGMLPTPAECNLLNDTCKIAGFDFNFGQSTKVIHLSEVTQRCQVSVLELPFDDPLSHAQYLDIVPLIKRQPEDYVLGIPPQANMTASELPPQVENVPPSVAPNMNPFGRYPPHYPPPPPATGAAGPPSYPYMNYMNMMRQQQFRPHGMTNYSMVPHGRFPTMPPETMQGGGGTVSNMNSPPRQQHMSSKPTHQPCLPSQTKPNTASSPYGMGTPRSPFGSNSGANSYGPNSSAKCYGVNPSRSPFGATSPTNQFVPGSSKQAQGNQSAMYMNRMMSSQLMPNGYSQASTPYLSQPGSRGPVNNVTRQHLTNTQRFKSPNVSVLPNTCTSNSVNAMKIPQRLQASKFAPNLPGSHIPGIGQSNLPTCSSQFPGDNRTACNSKFSGNNVLTRSPQFPLSPLSPVRSENHIANTSQISPSQMLASAPVSSVATKPPSTGTTTVPASKKITQESTDIMVSKITGVVLQGKSISCMAVNEAERTGQFCLIEAVCKLYFSRSTMDEFLYALQNVLKIPLYSCTEAEEKAFIQYYNLPVSILKCNKLIKLTDLNNYFPQMSYMFIPPPDEDKSDTAKASSSSASKTLPPAHAPGSESSDQQTGKRQSASPHSDVPVSKQPCRRLEEMVKKLKEDKGDEGSSEKASGEVIILDD